MDFTTVVLGLLLTAVSYMVFPLIKLWVNGGRFVTERAHKIALWNSIVVGTIFCIATTAVSETGTIWNGAPAVLYYWINRSVLKDRYAQESNEYPSKEIIEKSKKRKKSMVNIMKVVGALILGIISSDILLMIILGDSVEGATALLVMCLVAIPFFVLYFWLFLSYGKRTEIYEAVCEDVPPRPIIQSKGSRPPQISCESEQTKHYGNNVHGKDISLQSPSAPPVIMFCRKCGTKLLEGSQFCNKCGTNTLSEPTKKKSDAKVFQINPIEKLALLTVGLPATVADKSKEEMNIAKNQYAYCDAIIFVEFFIRASILELAPSKEIAIKISDTYIDAVIKETLSMVPDTEDFFADMFYSRATLYDNIFMNANDPIMDVVELLTHIIHKEIDDDSFVKTDNKSYRYFGGIFENLTIKTELVSLFQCINASIEDIMMELKEYMKTL